MSEHVNEEAVKGARDFREWYEALTAEGFTEEQAIRILTRPQFIVAGSSPNFEEMMSKMGILLDRDIADDT